MRKLGEGNLMKRREREYRMENPKRMKTLKDHNEFVYEKIFNKSIGLKFGDRSNITRNHIKYMEEQSFRG